MRKVKFTITEVKTLEEKIAFTEMSLQDGWFHVWENTNGIIEDKCGNVISISYTQFRFVENPRI